MRERKTNKSKKEGQMTTEERVENLPSREEKNIWASARSPAPQAN